MNLTIDDGDAIRVTYYPSMNDSSTIWRDQDCYPTICWIHPSKESAFGGTWHEITYHVGASPEVGFYFSFKGQFPIQTTVRLTRLWIFPRRRCCCLCVLHSRKSSGWTSNYHANTNELYLRWWLCVHLHTRPDVFGEFGVQPTCILSNWSLKRPTYRESEYLRSNSALYELWLCQVHVRALLLIGTQLLSSDDWNG